MAERFVHRLEVIHVDEQHRGPRAPVLRGGQQLRQHAHQVQAVGQLGERVVQRQEGGLLLRMLARGDVAPDHHAVVAIGVRHGLGHGLDLHRTAVLAEHHQLVGHFAAVAQVFEHEGAAFGLHDAEDGAPHQLGARVARHALGGVVAVEDDAVAVKGDGFFRGLGEFAHARLALQQGALGLPVAGDVADQHHDALHPPRGELGLQAHLQHALAPVQSGVRAGVLHRLAPQHALHVGLDHLPRGFAHRRAHRQADDAVNRLPVVLRIAPVGEHAAHVGRLVVGQHHRHRIGHQAQQRGGAARIRIQGGRRGQPGHGRSVYQSWRVFVDFSGIYCARSLPAAPG